jgi:hypothetical protein
VVPEPSRTSSVIITWSVAAVLLLAALVLGGIDAAKVPQSKPHLGTSDEAAAVLVARTEAINFFTLDYKNVDNQIATILKLSTNPFTKQYEAKQSDVKKGILAGKFTSSATVADDSTAVEYETAGQVVVLVAVDATTKTTTGSSETDRYRMRLTVQKVKSSWLVSSIEQVN